MNLPPLADGSKYQLAAPSRFECPDGSLIVCEPDGTIRVVSNGAMVLVQPQAPRRSEQDS